MLMGMIEGDAPKCCGRPKRKQTRALEDLGCGEEQEGG
jgi:hypothetical protein